MDIMKGVRTKGGLIIKKIETEPGVVNKPPENKAEYKQVTKLDYRLQSAEDAPSNKGVQRNTNRNTKATSLKADLKFPKAKRAEVKRPSVVEKHRFNIRIILQCSNATPIRAHYVGNGYACSFCDQFFLKAADLKTHTLEHHDMKEKAKFMQRAYMSLFVVKLDITALSCNLCEADLNTLEDLISHLKEDHNVTLYTDVKSQIICFKLDNEELKCMFCEAEFSSFKPLLEHMNRHYTNYVCDTCGAGFVTERMLGLHSEGHKQGRFECGTCKKVFNTLRSLKYHQRTAHAYPFRFKCFQCKEKFATLRLKKIHMTEFHGAEFADLPCLACDKTFKDKKALNLHTQRDHLKSRGFQCDVCFKSFYTNDTLKSHMIVHLGVRDFRCEICGKDFIRRNALMAHMLTHKEECRFMCEICGRKFLNQTSLDEHNMQLHIGELAGLQSKGNKKRKLCPPRT